MILGIDIGGANTKIASENGKIIELHYIPLWKNTRLQEKLIEAAIRLKPDKVAVVITGELADCFPDKDAGLSYITGAVNRAFNDAYFLDSSGNFIKEKSRNIAAANWVASASAIGKEYKDCIFLDVGSTTTDIIPIKDGRIIAARTDFERLRRGELIYSGALRTNIAAILNYLLIGNERSRISSELFAVTADAYLLLGMISPENYTCDTADGSGKSIIDAKRRIARVVCADLNEIKDEDIYSIAEQVLKAQVCELRNAINEISKIHSIRKIIACGIGEFLAKRAADEAGLELILLSEKYGEELSKVFPAYAAAVLLKEALL